MAVCRYCLNRALLCKLSYEARFLFLNVMTFTIGNLYYQKIMYHCYQNINMMFYFILIRILFFCCLNAEVIYKEGKIYTQNVIGFDKTR